MYWYILTTRFQTIILPLALLTHQLALTGEHYDHPQDKREHPNNKASSEGLEEGLDQKLLALMCPRRLD